MLLTVNAEVETKTQKENKMQIQMSLEAAQMIVVHNGNGGLQGAILRCEQVIARRARQGKESPRFDLLRLQLSALTEHDSGEVMYEARHMVGQV